MTERKRLKLAILCCCFPTVVLLGCSGKVRVFDHYSGDSGAGASAGSGDAGSGDAGSGGAGADGAGADGAGADGAGADGAGADGAGGAADSGGSGGAANGGGSGGAANSGGSGGAANGGGAGGAANCDGTVGGGCCSSGQTSCSGTCYNLQSDAQNCGACGKACTQGQTCSAGICQCALGASVCSSCLGWTFETGTQNWIKDSDPNEAAYGGGALNGAQSPVTSTTLVCPAESCPGSAHSLQVSLTLDTDQSIGDAGVAVSVCQSGATVDVNGRTISVHGYLAPDAGFGDIGVLSLLRADAWSPSGQISCPLVWGTQMASNAWFTGSCTFNQPFQANHVAVVLILSGSPWTGKMYLDDVQVN